MASQRRETVESLRETLLSNWPGETPQECLRAAEKASSSSDPLDQRRCTYCGSKKIIPKPGHREVPDKVDTPFKCGECLTHLETDEIDPAPAKILGDVREKIRNGVAAAGSLQCALLAENDTSNSISDMDARRQLADRFGSSLRLDDRQTTIRFRNNAAKAAVQSTSSGVVTSLLRRSDVDIVAVSANGVFLTGWCRDLHHVWFSGVEIDGVRAVVPKAALLLKSQPRSSDGDSSIVVERQEAADSSPPLTAYGGEK